MSKIANAFKIGDPITIKAGTTRPNGDKLPQAGKRGVVTDVPKAGRAIVDVAGFPVVNLSFDDLEAATAAAAPASAVSTQTPAAPAQAASYAMEVLQLSAIVPSLTNPRTYFDPEELKSLSEDIKLNGILQPILVRRLPGSRMQETFADRRKGDPRPTHELVAGERRYRACNMAGVRSVPVLMRELTDEQVLRMQLIENIQRADLHPLEEAQGYRRILDLESQADKSMGQRQEELANSIKRSTRYVYQTLQLLQLCDFARKVFLEGKLHRTTALEIATIGNEAGQIEATRRIAGLARTGTSTEVHETPMGQRAAHQYVANNHRLLLSKAPFNIKVELAGAPACGTCPKMSANAADLFEQGATTPDTCMDPSCYGKKNLAHCQAIADAAKASGQKVISGAAAKKIIPYSHREDDLDGGYTALTEKQYGAGMDGKTVQQLLGKNIEGVVLVQNPHKPGFIEALPTAEVKRLFKERGIGQAKDVGIDKYKKEQRDDARKDKEEKAFRWAWAEQLLERADNVDDVELLDDLLIPAAIQLYRRLDNECTKRTHKLMKWEFSPFGYNEKAKLIKHFKDMEPGDLNKFMICAIVTGELHIAQYCKPSTQGLDMMSEILKVDGKAIKAKLAAEAKAIEKAKADKAKAKLKPAPKKAPAAPAAAPAAALAPGQRVRFKEGLKGPAGHFRKCCGKSGTIATMNAGIFMVKVDGVTEAVRAERTELEVIAEQKPAHKTQWRAPTTAEKAAFKPGDRVRVTDDKSKLSGHSVKAAGKVFLLDRRIGAAWFLSGITYSLHEDELMIPTDAAALTAPAKPIATKATGKKTSNGRATEKQLDLALKGKGTLNPQSAWPFPLKGETMDQAAARSAAATKGARA